MGVVRETRLARGQYPETRPSGKIQFDGEGEVLLERYVVDADRVFVDFDNATETFKVYLDGEYCGGWMRVEIGNSTVYNALTPKHNVEVRLGEEVIFSVDRDWWPPTSLPDKAHLYRGVIE